MSTRMIVIAVVLLPLAGAAQVTMEFPGVTIGRDFVDAFPDATIENSSHASASRRESIDGIDLPGIFLHPAGQEDAIARFGDVAVGMRTERPRRDATAHWFLLFRIGIRDGIDWKTERHNKPNGVRFAVHVAGEKRFEETMAASEWRARAIDVTALRGQQIDIAFHTNAIGGDTNYDWAVFGQPILVRYAPQPREEMPADTAGIALAEVHCATQAAITVSMGDASTHASLDPGTHRLPVHFEALAPLDVAINQGAATVEAKWYAAHRAELEAVSLELSTPLITAGRPFNLIATIRNKGWGRLTEPRAYNAVCDFAGIETTHEAILDTMGPLETRTVVWRGLHADRTGAARIDVAEVGALRFHVFPKESDTTSAGLAAFNAKSRVRLGRDGDQA